MLSSNWEAYWPSIPRILAIRRHQRMFAGIGFPPPLVEHPEPGTQAGIHIMRELRDQGSLGPSDAELWTALQEEISASYGEAATVMLTKWANLYVLNREIVSSWHIWQNSIFYEQAEPQERWGAGV